MLSLPPFHSRRHPRNGQHWIGLMRAGASFQSSKSPAVRLALIIRLLCCSASARFGVLSSADIPLAAIAALASGAHQQHNRSWRARGILHRRQGNSQKRDAGEFQKDRKREDPRHKSSTPVTPLVGLHSLCSSCLFALHEGGRRERRRPCLPFTQHSWHDMT
ncbi:hypothetical protein GGR50DRAFT_229092 [Xylaria sp. CBS 124048]|nr:hypothetical protein GGR50DRAFT_229092 [Xylaria sp. CBS 124048]